MDARSLFTCPVCGRPLVLEARTYRCEAGHAFDRAREGYVDLLPVGHGKSGITGDTPAMARARQRFLARGHYARLADRLAARLTAHASERGARGAVVVEAGCGTGHYIGAIAEALPGARLVGLDVSRHALRLAARALPAVAFAVNDVTHRLCLPDASVDALLDVFAPRNAAEFRRVLRPDGLLVVVVPGDPHLAELRAALPLLSIPPDKTERTVDQLAPAFDLAWEEPLEWRTRLGREDVADLVHMSPSAFHLGDDARDTVGSLPEETPVTFSFRVLGFAPARGDP